MDALTLTKSNYGPAGAQVFVESPSWPLYRALNPYVKRDVSDGPAGANGATGGDVLRV